MDEIWKDVVGFEEMYQVSNFGRVKGLTRNDSIGRKRIEKIMKPYVMKLGYLQIHLSKNGVSEMSLVHQLVMDAFIGPCPKGLERNHIDGDKANNRIDNLEYCTRSENLLHAYRVLGITTTRGEDYWNAKLTEEQVIKIRQLHASGGTTIKAIAKTFAMNPETISRIVNRKTWRHL